VDEEVLAHWGVVAPKEKKKENVICVKINDKLL
jgi:hypothetical protein